MKEHKFCRSFFEATIPEEGAWPYEENDKEILILGYCKVCQKRMMKVYEFKGFFDREGHKIN